ncbi:MAG: TonB-dependent receptor [Brumimicrobium sp.]|nr:TonB-dependent receptor [Brumimicrobium sp.]MCO5269987.1 TonB-dependent receptor [Brumimicrobium sp.]
MKTLIYILLISCFTTFALGQGNFTIRGFVYDNVSGEAASYVKVLLKSVETGAQIGATTDLDGIFQFSKLNEGSYEINIRSMEHNEINEVIKVGASKVLTLRYTLEKADDVKEIEGVSVYGQDQSKQTKIDISVNKLKQEDLERLPSFGAENDIIAAFSITPGVITTGDQGGQMYVRGGTPIQNKIILDGMTIYNPFHSIGFFSVFETELIKNTDIYTGGFASNYGGRISSIMDITYRDGDLNRHGGMVSLSPFMAKAVVEGPLYKTKDAVGSGGSYILAAKHSLLNYVSKSIYPYTNNGDGLPFSFTDIFGKFTIKTPDGSKFNAFGFYNTDKVNYATLADLHWNAYGGGLNFTVVPQNNPVIIKGHLSSSGYDILFQEQNGQAPRYSKIIGFDLGFDFTYFLKNQSELTYGINVGGFTTKFLTYNQLDREIKIENFNTELSAYLNYRLIIGRWVVNPGVRLQVYPGLSAVIPEPRLGVKVNATEKLRFKLSGGYYSQNYTSASSDQDVVTLFYGFLAAPNNVQTKFTTPTGKEKLTKNGIQTSWHGIFGVEYDLTKSLSLNVEGYYKYFPKLSNINTTKLYDDTPEFNDKPDVFKKDFILESGYSYGVDVLLQFKKDRIFLWGGYSYGNSDRWNGFDHYVPVFDRKHNVNLVATYAFLKNKTLEVSVRWNFGSGLPFTPTSGYYQGEEFNNGLTTDYTTSNTQDLSILLGDMNSARLPSYHRLDITIKKRFPFKNKTELELKAGVTNMYNRDNIFYVNRVSNEKIYQLPILPSFGVSYKF